jgi:NAD(P)-dependent dehydrogenase (short-subunit alcohol dehydrogenase family)
MEKIFSGKRALVIGGSGGIGKAVALGLARRGASLAITGGNSPERLEETLTALDEINSKDSGIAPELQKTANIGFLCKIGSPEGFSPEAAAVFILEKTEIPDILVISWGPFKKIALQEAKPEDWRFLTENNLIFPGIMISSVLYGMISRGWGRILLFGGTKTAEIRGFSDTAAYGSAKTALGTLAKSVAKCAGKAGVCCNVICPGLIATEYSVPSEISLYKEKNPGEKVLTTGEIAHCALAVLENPGINGAIIPVDGGLWI